MSYDRRVLVLALVAGLPALTALALLLAFGEYTPRTRWSLGLLAVGGWLAAALALRDSLIRPLQTIANLVAALREEDYSIRARGGAPGDTLGLPLFEINALAEALRSQRLASLEAGALLQRVIAEIDAAIFTFDGADRLRLVNRAGAELLGRPSDRLLGLDAAALGLGPCLTGQVPRVAEMSFAGRPGRFEIRRSGFRQHGLPHHLVVLTDVRAVLREGEREAWRRLIRVLSHEINNSLTPIKSIAESLSAALERGGPGSLDDDFRQGLGIIAARSDGLRRFMAAYARLARLPPPTPRRVSVAELVGRVVALETRSAVRVTPGPDAELGADPDQLEQLLINLLGNAVDAMEGREGEVRVGWTVQREGLVLAVEDDGPGIADPANLFVPFFTTKPNGSGIGLALGRQIAEAHGGTIALENRPGGGARAVLTLPLHEPPRGSEAST